MMVGGVFYIKECYEKTTGMIAEMFFFLSRAFFCLLKFWSFCAGTAVGNLKLRLWGCRCNGPVRCFGVPRIEMAASRQIEIGKNNIFRSSVISNPVGICHPVYLVTRGAGHIRIGDDCGLSGVSIISFSSVTIGNRVQIGANTAIVDADFHPLDAASRAIPHATGKSAPIAIADDVFIGMNTLILKGVSIGRKSVIGAGSVVTKDIPSGVVAAGNPAHVIRKLDV